MLQAVSLISHDAVASCCSVVRGEDVVMVLLAEQLVQFLHNFEQVNFTSLLDGRAFSG